MNIESRFNHLPRHNALIQELLALPTAEERLSWLMERAPLHAQLKATDRIDALKVPGCLSGLWLKGEYSGGVCVFSTYSESELVHGVISFVCDLYSERSPAEILAIRGELAQQLRIDGLLSITRQRALAQALSFILSKAEKYIHYYD